MDLRPPNNREEGTPYYIVAVKLLPSPIDKDRRFCPRPHDWAWLAMDGGYYSHATYEGQAHRFTGPPTIDLIRAWSGFPWYDIHDKRVKPKVYKIWEYFKKEVELVP